MRRRTLITLAAAALASGCSSLPGAPALPGALQALPDAPLTAQQRLQWLDRVTWGANDSSDAGLQRLGLKAWLAQQLQLQDAPLPPQAQQLIDALDISRRSMQDIASGLAAQRKAAQQATGDEKTRLQQALQRQLNQWGTEAQTRFVVRALYSPAQLREQMTWFWMNHFSVSLRKADLRAWVGDYEERAIRPHALGRLRDLLEASMRHPAMLRYLDNASNAAGRINENYARELMELHTMGVDGGYTQADVQELARILTGVGVRLTPDDAPPRLRPAQRDDYLRDGFFEFNPARHDYGPKTFLGRPMRQRGMAEVGEALDRIAAAPATARFIARKLAVFFIADDPPAALVQRTAEAFTRSNGDMAATLAALLAAPEAERFGQKFRDPLHYVLAATRLSLDQRVATDVAPVLGWINRLGQNLYAHETPDGYPQMQSDWAGSGQMAARFEVARQMATRSAVLLRSDPRAPLEQPPYPTLSAMPSVRERLPQWSASTRAALAQARSTADWNTYFLSAPEMMFR